MNEKDTDIDREGLVPVQISYEALSADDRASNVPEDTSQLPYLVRVKGLTRGSPEIGEQMSVLTQSGRQISGTVEIIQPADTHTFGRPPLALVEMQREISVLLQTEEA